MKLRPAQEADLPAARALLAAVDLPQGGLEDQFDSGYVVAEREGRMIGLAGVELHDSFGLLRSVAVSPEARGSRVGERLVKDRLAWSERHGVRIVYLLTLTAADYFRRLGFSSIDRADLPPAIRRSREFASICPDSADALKCDLRPRGLR